MLILAALLMWTSGFMFLGALAGNHCREPFTIYIALISVGCAIAAVWLSWGVI